MRSIRVADAPPKSGWGEVVTLEARFAPMVERLEDLAGRHAAGYRRRAVAAGLLGYGVLGGVLILFLGLAGLMVVLMFTASAGLAAEIKGLLIFGAIAFALIRALWVARTPPEGVAVTAEQTPAMFEMVSRVREASGGPPIHAVRITDQMNAAITQETRFLFLGTYNTLYLGLPLLAGMRAPEVESVVAHEFGHFVGRHGRSASFAYRIRKRWAQTAEGLPDGIVAGALRRFFAWYGPWFASYSFVLARQQEYEADRTAARVSGSHIAAQALTRVSVQAERFTSAWSAIWSQATVRDDPPSSPYRSIAAALDGDDPGDCAALGRALASPPDLDDTHPTLAQRLAALGESAELPPTLGTPAAAVLLGETANTLVAHFDAQWHESADVAWAEEYAQREAEHVERELLVGGIGGGDQSRDNLYRYAWLTELIDGPALAEAAYAAVLDQYPEAQDARFRRGDLLLDLGQEEGIALLLEAGSAEPALQRHALGRVIDFLVADDRGEAAIPYIDLLHAADENDALAKAEAGAIDESVVLRPLDDATREKLVELSSGVTGVKWLHAALRDLRRAAEPQIVFVFAPEKGTTGAGALDLLIEALLPAGDLLGIEGSRQRRWLAKRIGALPGSGIISSSADLR